MSNEDCFTTRWDLVLPGAALDAVLDGTPGRRELCASYLADFAFWGSCAVPRPPR